MSIRSNYQHTIYACYIGYIVQAIVNNFAPLLFLTFQSSFGLSLDKVSLLVTLNFGVQLVVDLLSAKFVDKIGYRPCMIAAHVLSALGLAGLAVFPFILPNAYAGLIAAIMLYAVGGGLLEVLVSPIVEACPTEGKEAAMSLLHSFYCWGHVFVVLVSTAFFALFGTANWRVMACIWAIVPALNAVYFTKVPINTLSSGDGEAGMSMGALAKERHILAAYAADGMRGRVGAGDEPVGQRICRGWSGREQDDGRPARAVHVCDNDGSFARALFKAGRQAPAGARDERVRRAVHNKLPAGGSEPKSGAGFDRLRSMRLLGRHNVAGRVLHGR